jgi:hypothetical protein
MADREFKIKLTGDATELQSSAKQGASALNEVAQASQEDSRNTAELAKKTEFLTLKKGELKKIVRELSRDFPEAGMAARAMLNPIVFAFTGAISIFAYAKQKLEEWNKEMDEVAASNARSNLIAGIQAQKQAFSEGAAAASNFAQSLQAIATAVDKIKKAIDHDFSKLHEITQGQSGINSAAEARDLAMIDWQVKSGKLSEPQGTIARADVRERYARMQDDLKTKSEQEELRLHQSELEARTKAAPELASSESSARALRDDMAAKLARAKTDLPTGKQSLTELQAKLEKRLDELDFAQADFEKVRNTEDKPSIYATRKNLDAAKAKAEEAQQARDLQRTTNSRNESFIQDAEANGMPYAQSRLNTAETSLRTNTERIRSLSDTIPDEREMDGYRQTARSAAGNLRYQTGRIESGSQLQEQRNQLEQQMDRLTESGKGINVTMIDSLKKLIKLQQDNNDALKDFDKRIGSLEGYRKANRFGL